MRQEQIYEDDVDENGYRGPSKSQLKREQNALQDLGRQMTKLGDEQLKRIGLPDEVLVEIVEFRRMRSFGAQRRQLQLIGKKMRNMDPVAVREAIDRVTGESRRRRPASPLRDAARPNACRRRSAHQIHQRASRS